MRKIALTCLVGTLVLLALFFSGTGTGRRVIYEGVFHAGGLRTQAWALENMAEEGLDAYPFFYQLFEQIDRHKTHEQRIHRALEDLAVDAEVEELLAWIRSCHTKAEDMGALALRSRFGIHDIEARMSRGPIHVDERETFERVYDAITLQIPHIKSSAARSRLIGLLSFDLVGHRKRLTTLLEGSNPTVRRTVVCDVLLSEMHQYDWTSISRRDPRFTRALLKQLAKTLHSNTKEQAGLTRSLLSALGEPGQCSIPVLEAYLRSPRPQHALFCAELFNKIVQLQPEPEDPLVFESY